MRSLLSNNKGTLRLLRFIARRDWLKSLIWLVGFAVFATVIPNILHSIYGATSQTIKAMVPMLENPAMIAMVGPVFDGANYTIGAMTAGELLIFVGITVAFMNIMFVVRYTRAEEEKERMEMIRSLPVGRLSPLNAALIGAVILNVLVLLITWIGMTAMNIPTIDSTGAFLYGASLAAIGLVFAAVAAICSQIASTSRGAIAYTSGVLGVLYLIRAVGDMQLKTASWAETVSRLSPLGLALRTKAFVTNEFWPLPILVAEALLLVFVAYWLNSRRDLGAGLVQPKQGPAHAGAGLSSAPGLALRLLRNTIIGWAYVALVTSASYGSIMNTIANFIKTSPFFKDALATTTGYSITEAFAALIMVVTTAMVVAGPLQMVMKAWGEEESGRGEIVLSTGVSRMGFFGSYAAIALVCSVIFPSLASLGLWGAAALVMKSNPLSVAFVFKAQMVYLPAIWVLLGLALLMIAVAPRLAPAVSWGYFGFSFFMGYMGQLLGASKGFPKWLPKLSAFGNIPNITKDHINWTTLGVMTGIALVMIVAAFILYRRRDFETS